jgi:hypothetical protein
MPLPTVLPWLAVFAVCILCTARRYAFLQESPYPLGIDGYFYPTQLRSILETGWLDSPTSPLSFFLMTPLAWLSDPITGSKLGAAIGPVLAVIPAYAVATRLSSSQVAGVLAATIVGVSHGAFYLSVEFVKNGFGITAALMLLWMILRAVEAPTAKRLSAVVAAVLTHKIAAPLAIVVVCPGVAVYGWRRRGWNWRQPSVVALLVTAVVVVSAIGAWAAVAAGAELSILFTSQPRWQAPALQIPSVTLSMGYEALLAGAVGLAWLSSSWWLFRKPRSSIKLDADNASSMHRSITTTLAVFGVFLALPWLDAGNPQGLTFRLRIVAFVPLALVGSVLVAKLADRVAARFGGHLGVLAVTVAIVIAAPTRLTQGVIRAHPAMVSAIQALHDEIPRGKTIVVSERHIAFMVHWYTRSSTRLRPESVRADQRVRLVTLAFIGSGSALEHTIDLARNTPIVTPPVGVHPMHRNGLVLIEEDTWQWILDQLPDNLRARPARWPVI